MGLLSAVLENPGKSGTRSAEYDDINGSRYVTLFMLDETSLRLLLFVRSCGAIREPPLPSVESSVSDFHPHVSRRCHSFLLVSVRRVAKPNRRSRILCRSRRRVGIPLSAVRDSTWYTVLAVGHCIREGTDGQTDG